MGTDETREADHTEAPAGEERDPAYAVSDAEALQISGDLLAQARRTTAEQVASLPPAEREHALELEQQLAANDYQISPQKKWWGFQVVLNAKAAMDVADLFELIGDYAGDILGKKLGLIVEVYCKSRAILIRAVGKDYGCRLVSPWIAPGMLFPIPLAPKEDTHLWWTVMDSDHQWSEDQKFPDHRTKSNPDLAEYRGSLYCVHRGDADGRLWWTVYDPDSEDGWTEDKPFPNHYSKEGPALAVFNDRLYCVHRGNGSDDNLYWTRFDGTSWSADTKLGNQKTDKGPALAVFGGRLYCAYKGTGSSTQLYWCTFNGTSWTTDQTFGSHRSSSNPALAVYKNQLYAVYSGSDTTRLHAARFNSTTNSWNVDSGLPNHHSKEGPALAVFNDHLYCVHRGGTDSSLWWTRFNGSTWSADTRLADHYSGPGPAAIVYRDPNGTEDQLFCIHRGS